MNFKEVIIMEGKYKILHPFRWQLVDVLNALPKIKEQGFNAIQLTPVQECLDGWEWWKVYQPLSYKIGNQYGSEEDLKVLCYASETYGIDIFVDVLFHNVASLDGTDVHPDVAPELAKHVLDVPPCTNYEDRYQTTHLSVGLPMVDYWNTDVRNMQFDFLKKLRNYGVKGFRIDQAKHFATVDEGCNYFTVVYIPFKDKGSFIYGEVLNAPADVIDMYSKTMYVLTEWIKGSDKNKLVTFVESHDEYYGIKNKQYLTKELILERWNELVNNQEVHSLFFVRPMEDEKGLSNLWASEEVKQINFGG